MSKTAEKVTPDSKFSKSCTSSSLTSSAATEKDDPTVCNLESRLDAAALVDSSGGVWGEKFGLKLVYMKYSRSVFPTTIEVNMGVYELCFGSSTSKI